MDSGTFSEALDLDTANQAPTRLPQSQSMSIAEFNSFISEHSSLSSADFDKSLRTASRRTKSGEPDEVKR